MLKNSKKENAIMRQIYKECAVALWVPLLLTVAAEGLSGILTVVTANTLGKFADAVFVLDFSMGMRNVITIVACVLVISICSPLLGMLGDFSMLKSALRHDRKMLEHYLNKDSENAVSVEEGEWQYLLEDEPNTLRIQWVKLISKILVVPVYGGYLLYCSGSIHYFLTIFMFALAAIKLAAPVFFKKKLAEYDKAQKQYAAKRRTFEADVINYPYIAKNWGLQKVLLERINKLFADYFYEKQSHQINCQVFFEKLTDFIGQFTQLLLIVAGAILVVNGKITPGEAASMLVYFTIVQTLLNHIVDIIQNYPLMRNAAETVSKIYQDTEQISGENVTSFSVLEGKEVSFRFPDKPIFENLEFSIKKGEKVGIRGENGSGKSTLCRIFATLIKGYEGHLFIDEKEMREVNKADWREIMTYVPQKAEVFGATVRENVMMGNRQASKEEADELLGKFGISSIADRMITAESELSGGEKQKISLVRALLRKSELLILDEPSNHLDKESVEALKEYIAKTSKTVILISHDTELLEQTDRCLEMTAKCS